LFEERNMKNKQSKKILLIGYGYEKIVTLYFQK